MMRSLSKMRSSNPQHNLHHLLTLAYHHHHHHSKWPQLKIVLTMKNLFRMTNNPQYNNRNLLRTVTMMKNISREMFKNRLPSHYHHHHHRNNMECLIPHR